MAEIIEFPLSIEREWARVGAAIREKMEREQVPEEVMDHVLSWHKEMFGRYKKKPLIFDVKQECMASQSAAAACSEAIAEGFKKVKSDFNRFAAEMMLEMTDLKIELEITKATSEFPTHPPHS